MENKQLDKITILQNGLFVLAEHYNGLQTKASTKAALNPERDRILYQAYLIKKFMCKIVKNYSISELEELSSNLNDEQELHINNAYYHAAKLNIVEATKARKKAYICKTVLDVTNCETNHRKQIHLEAQEFSK